MSATGRRRIGLDLLVEPSWLDAQKSDVIEAYRPTMLQRSADYWRKMVRTVQGGAPEERSACTGCTGSARHQRRRGSSEGIYRRGQTWERQTIAGSGRGRCGCLGGATTSQAKVEQTVTLEGLRMNSASLARLRRAYQRRHHVGCIMKEPTTLVPFDSVPTA